MHAVALTRGLPIDDEQSLVDVELPDPRPEPRDVLVEVRAASVNPVDVKQRAGSPEVETPRVLGYDGAGVVREVGEGVTLFRPGDEVWWAGQLDRQGSDADLQLVDERIVGRKPASLGFAEAAALPLTTITAWECLFDKLGLDEGSEGDLLVAGDKLLAGTGFRTELAAHAEAGEVLGLPVVTLDLIDPSYYHLDTALCVLDATNIAYFPGAFSPSSQMRLEELFPDAVIADAADAAVLGLNAVSDGLHVVLPIEADALAEKLRALGYRPVPVAKWRPRYSDYAHLERLIESEAEW